MIIDAHADISGFLVRQAKSGHCMALEEAVLPNLQTGGITGVVNAVYLDKQELNTPKASALRQIEELRRQIDLSQDMAIVTSAGELEAAYQRDQIGVFLSLEGAEPIEEMTDLDVFYEAGVRMIGLTWNGANRYAGGCAAPHFGLTNQGIELLDRMARKNMLLDLSHLSDPATDEALERFQGLPIASHSNARSYANHVRNMTDEQLRRVAERGGVVGLNAISLFVSELFPSVEHLQRQLDYLIYTCGEDHVGFGFDFCDRYFPGPKEDGFDVLAGPELVYDFQESLRLPGRIKDKIAWQNWLRIYETL